MNIKQAFSNVFPEAECYPGYSKKKFWNQADLGLLLGLAITCAALNLRLNLSELLFSNMKDGDKLHTVIIR